MMRSTPVQGGLRRLQLTRYRNLNASPTLGATSVPKGGFTFRNLISCVHKRPAPRTFVVATSLFPSSLIHTIDGCSGGRGDGMLNYVRYTKGHVHRRRNSQVQLGLLDRARYSSTPLQPAPAASRPSSILCTRSCSFTTSADGASKKLEVLDGTHVAEADVAEVTEPSKAEPRHAHIEMPSITDAERIATLTSWKVEVGDVIQVGDVVCEIELEHFSVGVKVETPGFLAEILVAAGTESVPVGADIGTIVHSEEDIKYYQQAQRAQVPVGEQKEAAADHQETFSWKDVLKDILRLRKDDKLSEDDASVLMSLARNRDAEILQAFEGCFEGDEYKGEIDDDLFLAQVVDIARTRRRQEAGDSS